jgi:hypothetical protein
MRSLRKAIRRPQPDNSSVWLPVLLRKMMFGSSEIRSGIDVTVPNR